ncbi:hypothetical protein [Proteiniphilum sp.]|uniref:hypothetical protein n=1 Tax=Proteiniphilum sp. TaxID=1926877 RepID=UPI002B1EE009|nr:hypothetical protein [Proteiniphilum sp.]MEA4918154.1 hypothetical protein [Proteiniphilum sp.]
MKQVIILLSILLLLAGCGTKKFTSHTDRDEKTKFSLVDSSTIVKNIEQEKQFVDTHTRERIVTYYGVKLVPHLVNGDTVYVPVSYPERKEEERDINEQTEIWKTRVQDSIRNAIDLQYRNNLKEKEKKVSEIKESTILWQVGSLVASIAAFILLILYIWQKKQKIMI